MGGTKTSESDSYEDSEVQDQCDLESSLQPACSMVTFDSEIEPSSRKKRDLTNLDQIARMLLKRNRG